MVSAGWLFHWRQLCLQELKLWLDDVVENCSDTVGLLLEEELLRATPEAAAWGPNRSEGLQEDLPGAQRRTYAAERPQSGVPRSDRETLQSGGRGTLQSGGRGRAAEAEERRVAPAFAHVAEARGQRLRAERRQLGFEEWAGGMEGALVGEQTVEEWYDGVESAREPARALVACRR